MFPRSSLVRPCALACSSSGATCVVQPWPVQHRGARAGLGAQEGGCGSQALSPAVAPTVDGAESKTPHFFLCLPHLFFPPLSDAVRPPLSLSLPPSLGPSLPSSGPFLPCFRPGRRWLVSWPMAAAAPAGDPGVACLVYGTTAPFVLRIAAKGNSGKERGARRRRSPAEAWT